MMRRGRLVAVLAASTLTLSGCGFKGLYSTPLPGGADLGDHPYTVTAYFSDVLDLVPQSAVKVDDVPVGKVTNITLADCPNPDGALNKDGTRNQVWCAKVKVQVNGKVDLPGNAGADILQTSLLGEKYVSLNKPANGVGTLRNGSQIPLSATTSAPETEDVLGALSLILNKGGLNQIQVIASELNKAIGSKDRQVATRDLITQLSSFTGTLNDQRAKITTALDNIDTLAITLNKQKKIIADSLDTFPQALSVLEQERGKLVTLLTSLSKLGGTAKNVINATQKDLVAALQSLDPVVKKLAAVGPDLVKALKIGGTFPFPLGLTNKFVKGDYANLAADVTVNLNDLVGGLCGSAGLDPKLCTTLTGIVGSLTAKGEGSTKVTVKSAPAATITPTLLGSGS